MKILSVGAELFHVDGLTDMKKLTVTSLRSANAPKQKCIICQNVSESTEDVNYILLSSRQVRKLQTYFFYDRMTVHRNRFIVNKTNRCTEFQFYCYYDSTCFGQPFCPSSGVLSRTSTLVHFMQL